MNALRFAVITAFFTVLSFSHMPAFAASDQEKVKVFACEPEWAALAQEIGGDKVETFSATSAVQNPHYIRARPGKQFANQLNALYQECFNETVVVK